MTFAQALNAEMDRQNVTQADVARETGITTAGISHYCNELRQPTLAQYAILVSHYPRLLLWLLDQAFGPDRKMR